MIGCSKLLLSRAAGTKSRWWRGRRCWCHPLQVVFYFLFSFKVWCIDYLWLYPCLLLIWSTPRLLLFQPLFARVQMFSCVLPLWDSLVLMNCSFCLSLLRSLNNSVIVKHCKDCHWIKRMTNFIAAGCGVNLTVFLPLEMRNLTVKNTPVSRPLWGK